MAQQPLVGQGLSLSKLHNYVIRHTTLGKTLLDDTSSRRTDLCLTTYNTHMRQTSVTPAGFELVVPASEPSLTHALNRAATEIGFSLL